MTPQHYAIGVVIAALFGGFFALGIKDRAPRAIAVGAAGLVALICAVLLN